MSFKNYTLGLKNGLTPFLKIAFLLLVIIIYSIEQNYAYCGNTNSTNQVKCYLSKYYDIDAFVNLLKKSPSKAEDVKGNVIPTEQLVVERQWNGCVCKTTVKNISQVSIYPSNIILFDIQNYGLDAESKVYGEGFQMLHQNGGTLAQRRDIGGNADNKHYNIPDQHGLPTAYGVLTVSIKTDEHLLLGFTSCRRFIGRISFDARQMQVSIDAEGLEIKPGESWVLEDFILLGGYDRRLLFDQLSTEITKNHPQRKTLTIPTGWCSWYCYGPTVTTQIIENNLNSFARILPQMKYVQIDDGYQSFMGDWLDENPSYGNIQKTLAAIKAKGFEPAIWVAPFIAESKSRIFKEHSYWFVKDIDGTPLKSSNVGFGGWRNGSWYVLDGK